jgi:hypothetical protein
MTRFKMNKNGGMQDITGAHSQGWNAGLNGGQKLYLNPVNEYQKEFNRGFRAGEYFKLSKD